ncbi:MAG TPA: citrate transporter, partial [Pseudomonas sp.]|nr:citrate transporter [Pseudomonas sp.]
ENTGFGISPVVPSVYLAIGLAGVELYKHIRYTVLWAWGISLVMLAAAVVFGVVTV